MGSAEALYQPSHNLSNGHGAAPLDNLSLTGVIEAGNTTAVPGSDKSVIVWIHPEPMKQTPEMTILFSLAYLIVFCLAVVSNSLVLTLIIRNPQMRNVTNYFLANLAVADIVVSFVVLPITLLNNLFREWIFSEVLCKGTPYVQALAVGASVNTLAAVALERFFAIFFPHKTLITPRIAFVIIAFIWIVPASIQIPWAVYFKLELMQFPMNGYVEMNICYLSFGNTPKAKAIEKGFFLGGVFLLCYLIPLCFISIVYTLIGIKVWKRNVAGIRGSKAERNIQRSKIRIVRMLITVATVFALLWLPLYVIRMRIYFGSPFKGKEKEIVTNIIIPIGQWLGSANSCVNPFIYCFFSEQFRKGILTLLKSISSCCQSQPSAQRMSVTAITTEKPSTGEMTCHTNV